METNQISDQQFKKLQDEIKEMHTKYNTLSSDVKILQESQAAIRENLNAVSGGFDKLNGGMAEILEKLNTISEEQHNSKVNKMLGDEDRSIGKAIKKPLRKLAVGTISAIMCVGDYVVEKAASTKEGLEDIVAEASYNNKKKHEPIFEGATS